MEISGEEIFFHLNIPNLFVTRQNEFVTLKLLKICKEGQNVFSFEVCKLYLYHFKFKGLSTVQLSNKTSTKA